MLDAYIAIKYIVNLGIRIGVNLLQFFILAINVNYTLTEVLKSILKKRQLNLSKKEISFSRGIKMNITDEERNEFFEVLKDALKEKEDIDCFGKVRAYKRRIGAEKFEVIGATHTSREWSMFCVRCSYIADAERKFKEGKGEFKL